jgi:hypothetical protein
MVVAPLVTMVAFFIHPQFWTFKRETSASIQFDYIQDVGWQIGHVLVYLTIPLVIIAWLQIAYLVRDRKPVLAAAGGVLTIVGMVFMAGTFASTLTEGMIGLTLPREQAVPVIQLIMDAPGLMQITLWGQLGALSGPSLLSVAMALTPEVARRWAGISALLGNLLIAIFLDIDGLMIWGELLILVGLWPVAMRLLKGGASARSDFGRVGLLRRVHSSADRGPGTPTSVQRTAVLEQRTGPSAASRPRGV